MSRQPSLLLLLLGSTACGGVTTPSNPPPDLGAIRVHVVTHGSAIDPDGYTVVLDYEDSARVGIQDSLTLSRLQKGSHSLQLADLDPACQVSAANPQTVTVTGGQSAIARFDVVCAPPGALAVTVSTTGTLLDSDGYTLTLSGVGNAIIALPPNGTVTMRGLRPGVWQAAVTGVASNCRPTATPPVRIDSAATSSLRIDVQCSTPSGVGQIRVVVSTTAILTPTPTSYLLFVDGGPGTPITSSGSVTLAGIPIGVHQVRLGGLPSYCGTLPPAPPLTQTVPLLWPGAVVSIRFSVLCLP
jgi:hypothetical protein